ncbi:hypothetical protein KV097_05325 [Mumia sp. zg.B17]|uniref:HAAS signaling domain-containing protein n=1 Tax=Mumia sp. zg.B17 TaxID=2855446 RepID=UPI001C6E41E2|nr:hypothetical protein [Mumia sp. zg.B17]MBW9205359.1 hypothetical protein [Mumia sp. zg.B17]
MTTALTDSYVRAATRWLPGQTRREVEAELRERITDTVAARGDSTDAEREVLEEMGDPLLVAVEYTGREPRLIGPRFFMPWLRLLVLVLVIVLPIVGTVHIISGVTSDDNIVTTLVGAVGVMISAAIQVAFWVTAVFALVEWSGVGESEVTERWTVDKLPAAAATRSGRPYAETIASLVFLAVMAFLLIGQQTNSPIRLDGESIPALDPALWGSWIPIVLGLIALEIVFTLWVHIKGWTWTAAGINAAFGVAFAAVTVPVLKSGDFLNPELVDRLGWDTSTLDQVTQGILVGVLVVTAWDVIDGVLKARRASR